MNLIPYINYFELNDYYTIEETCTLFEMSKKDLKRYCDKHGVQPTKGSGGQYGFLMYDIRMLHNQIYREQRAKNTSPEKEAVDPWA